MLTKDFRGHYLSLFVRSEISQREYQKGPRVKESGIKGPTEPWFRQSLGSGRARQSLFCLLNHFCI